MNFVIGETAICTCDVRDSDNKLIDADTMAITISCNCSGEESALMVKDSTGKYHYDFQTTGHQKEKCEVYFTATLGGRIAKTRNTFNLI